MKTVLIDGNTLNLEGFISVVRKGYKVQLTEEAVKELKKQDE